MKFKFLFNLLLMLCFDLHATEDIFLLRNNLQRAQTGDYIVTTQNKNYTILLVRGRENDNLNIEEITVPHSRISGKSFSWKQWVEQGAQGNTCWVMYPIHLPTGTIQKVFSFNKNEWMTIPQSQNFLSTLLSLQFQQVPQMERRKIGPPPLFGSQDNRSAWQPPLVVDGNIIPNITFTAWRTLWPKDGSDLAGRTVEIFLPDDQNKYPAYFPYWLQISGPLGKAKVRIVDSGSSLSSPGRIP